MLEFILGIPGIILLFVILAAGLKVVNEYERGVKFTLGKYVGLMEPGLRFVFPIIQTWERVDIRTKVLDVPSQDAMTKDNVSVNINAVLYYNVTDSSKAVMEVNNFNYAASQLAQITMKHIVGQADLDELLSNREALSEKIRTIVDEETDPWGIKVENVDLKHIEVPNELQRMMARVAEGEREKRSAIIKAEGEVQAAANLVKAAQQLEGAPGALHIRTLHSINDLSSDKSQTIIAALPLEILRLIRK
ncbi:MAG: slipin family protein [Candidatus Woesearchaeota archaeon]